MDSLFGVEVTGAARFIIAFVVVLALIAVTAWLVRRFGSGALSSGGGRGRQPRLAVIDAAVVDARRKLILVRRDNVEHLLMIGGPSDVVIEPTIVRATSGVRDVPTARTAPIPEAIPRPVPLEEETMWPLQPEPAPRPQRPATPVASQWSASAHHQPADIPVRAQHPDTLAAQSPPRAEPDPAPEPRVSAQFATPATDPNLAEMAQQLEAVLRRPAGGAPRLDIPTDQPRPIEPSIEPHPVAHAPEPAHREIPEVRPVPPEARPGVSKNFYEDLEQEMASLLGRPTGKT
ncbi:MAG: flagellar biosynthesis protein FliO [Rhizobiales bacterium]|nr:flagellar biosynthesis protein FliO [Hyphomicrobiales bacterium]